MNSDSRSDSSGSYTTAETRIDHGEVAWAEACTPAFMAANTDAADFETFARNGGFDISTQEGIDKILPSVLDEYVNAHTRFPTWSEMKTRAFADWSRRRGAEEAGVHVREPKPVTQSPSEDSSDNHRRKSDRPLDD